MCITPTNSYASCNTTEEVANAAASTNMQTHPKMKHYV